MIMSNEILWIVFLLLDLSAATLIFKYFRKEGLYFIIGINIILCNIQVMKVVEIFSVTVTLGNIMYGSIYFATDLLNEFYGRKEAYRGVLVGFIALIMMTVFMQLSLMFTPAPDDFINPALVEIFSLMPRIALASITAYIVSQIHDVWIYSIYKAKTRGKYLWLRNNLSTMVSQLIDSAIFVFIAFWGLFPRDIFISIFITTYIIKFIVAALDTPFIYICRKIVGGER